jgi:hypothetical protein
MYPEVLEAQSSRYATTTLVVHCFRDIEPEVTGIPHFLFLNFDEVMIATGGYRKIITA